MTKPEIQLTDADWEAARDAIGLKPALATDVWTEDPERHLAELHQQWGANRFQLNLGLREPTNEAERCLLEWFWGAISKEEAQGRIRAYVNRPVDSEMLHVFFCEIEQQLQRYGDFMQEVTGLLLNPSLQPVTEADEAHVDRLVEALQAKPQQDKKELNSVFRFLQEARIEKNMGKLQLGEFQTLTAAEMVVAVTLRAQESWKINRALGKKSKTEPQYIKAVPGYVLFGQTCYPTLPRAQEVAALLEEEHALARVCLRERQGAAVPAEVSETKTMSPDDSVLLAVDHWSELAIGVDETGRYWAITPVPDRGTHFKKSQAVELVLPGGRWKAVLAVLAESEEDSIARRADLVQRLGYFTPEATIPRDGRARPGAVESAQIDGMKVRQLAALNRLNSTLSDLRRELGQLVHGPQERSQICLRTEKDVVHSGFVVRYLTRDASDRLIFGTVL